jgi:membrane protein
MSRTQTSADQTSSRAGDGNRNPDSPTDLTKPTWTYVAKKALREFQRDNAMDEAAGLTYYGVLALFPAMIALLSLVGLVGESERTVDTILTSLEGLGVGQALDTIRPVLESLASESARPGIAFAFGLGTALFSASGYVGSFGRAMNRIYEVQEGRPVWKLRPMMMLVTLVALLLAALVLLGIVVSGPVARGIGDAIGVGETAVTVWNIAKWPFMLAGVVVIIAILYYATPNVKQPKFRWVSVGAVVAIVVWLLASLAFGFYVGNFSSYNKTYGTLAGVVIFLLWLWITNLALLFGAELDAELERGRELQKGLPAEETLQLPPRDTHGIEKTARQQQEEAERGRALRESAGERE